MKFSQPDRLLLMNLALHSPEGGHLDHLTVTTLLATLILQLKPKGRGHEEVKVRIDLSHWTPSS